MYLNHAIHLHMLWNSLLFFFIIGQKSGVCCDIWSYFSADRSLCWSVDGVRLNELQVYCPSIYVLQHHAYTHLIPFCSCMLSHLLTQYVIAYSLFIIFSSLNGSKALLWMMRACSISERKTLFFGIFYAIVHFLICLIVEYSDNSISVVNFGYI